MNRILIAFAAIVLCAVAQPYPFVVHSQPQSKFHRSSRSIPNQYIVAFNDDFARSRIASRAKTLAGQYGGKIMFIYEDAIKGFAVEMPEPAAIALSKNPLIESVSENSYFTVTGTQTAAQGPTTFFGLDRIDQFDLPLNDTYNYNRVGSGVHAYVLDTGIWVTHEDFGTRALTVDALDGGFDSFGGDGIDRQNHGTFVAGVIGGKTHGVAKNVELHSVKVCNDSGTCPESNMLAGLNWLISHHTKPAVANLSFAGPVSTNLDNAVRSTVTAGVTVVVAAGNGNADASFTSPARVSEAITVGATTRFDTKASYSNFGFGVDVFAPGGESPDQFIPVPGSGFNFGGANNINEGFTGTSAAAPHVAGVVALYLEQYSLNSPNDPATSPANVSSVITSNATPGRLTGIGVSPNRLLYSLFVAAPATNPVDDTRFFVRQQYYDFLRRPPDQSGWDFHSNNINSCGADAECKKVWRAATVRGFMESPEFRNAHPILRDNAVGSQAYNEEFVRQLYRCALQREADPGGFAFHMNFINSFPGSYTTLIGHFIESPEYLQRFI